MYSQRNETREEKNLYKVIDVIQSTWSITKV